MNAHLEQLLDRRGIPFQRLRKSQKVKLLARWVGAFPQLASSARRQESAEGVELDLQADLAYADLAPSPFFILPDDDSGMPACSCASAKPPDLSELVSDTYAKCDELVVVDADFRWSAVFVNHGSPQLVGRHFAWSAV